MDINDDCMGASDDWQEANPVVVLGAFAANGMGRTDNVRVIKSEICTEQRQQVGRGKGKKHKQWDRR